MVGCGSSSSSGGFVSTTGRTADSGGYICKNQSCAAEDTYYSCLASKCDAQAKTCFGASYASGTFGGSCKTLIDCTMACPCDTTGPACLANCYAAVITTDAVCTACVGSITTCQSTSNCGTPATCAIDAGTANYDSSAATSPIDASAASYDSIASYDGIASYDSTATIDSSATTGTNCAVAQTCCASIPAVATAYVQECQGALAAAGTDDTKCATIVNGFKAYGLCL